MPPAEDQVSPPTAAPTEAVAGAGGLVFDPEGRVLVLLHANGSWVFPKGHLEGSETALHAALREVAEEAGVVATCPDPGLNWVTNYRNAHGTLRRITYFACASNGSTPQPTEDTFVSARYLHPRAATERLTYEVDRDVLERALAEAPLPALKLPERELPA